MIQDRRRFLVTALLGYIGLQLPSTVFAGTTKFPLVSNPPFEGTLYDTIPQKLRTAALARKAHNYSAAISVYDDILSTDPEELRAYDGKRKILLQSKYKELEVLQMYQNALALFPLNEGLKKRVASEYVRLGMGNKKFTTQLSLSDDPITTAQAILQNVTDGQQDTFVQLLKTGRLIDFNVVTTDCRNNPQMKAQRKQYQLEHKGRFALLSAADVKVQLEDMLTQTQNDYRDNNVRELYRVYIEKLKQEQNFGAAAKVASVLFQFDQQDFHSLKIARRVARKNEKYADLENIERQNDSNKQSYWSKQALFDVLFLRYRKENVGSLTELTGILNSMAYKRYAFYPDFEYRVRQVKLAMLKGYQAEALTLLGSFADRLTQTGSAHFINKFNILCMRYYLVQNDKAKALQVLSIGLKENDIDGPDPLMTKIIILNRLKENNANEHKTTLLWYRDRILNG